ncbi:uncharacterized protein LOC144016521 isoform X1 [Festucalex cinctus]
MERPARLLLLSELRVRNVGHEVSLCRSLLTWKRRTSSPVYHPFRPSVCHSVRVSEIISVREEEEEEEQKRKRDDDGSWKKIRENQNKDCRRSFTVSYVERCRQHRWRCADVTFTCPQAALCRRWVSAIRELLAAIGSRPTHLLVYINPYGGKRQAKRVYQHKVAPLFALAGIGAHVIVTEYANHARDHLREEAELKKYDGVVCVGGDGMFSELVHGLLWRAQKDAGVDVNRPEQALAACSLRIGIIPAGSTDCICFATVGTNDPVTSALHIIVGQSHESRPSDSVFQSNERALNPGRRQSSDGRVLGAPRRRLPALLAVAARLRFLRRRAGRQRAEALDGPRQVRPGRTQDLPHAPPLRGHRVLPAGRRRRRRPGGAHGRLQVSSRLFGLSRQQETFVGPDAPEGVQRKCRRRRLCRLADDPRQVPGHQRGHHELRVPPQPQRPFARRPPGRRHRRPHPGAQVLPPRLPPAPPAAHQQGRPVRPVLRGGAPRAALPLHAAPLPQPVGVGVGAAGREAADLRPHLPGPPGLRLRARLRQLELRRRDPPARRRRRQSASAADPTVCPRHRGGGHV